MSSKLARGLALGAMVFAAAAGPTYAALTAPATSAAGIQAAPPCLAWFGARGTGKCIGWAMDSSPSASIGTNGITTGPLLPGQAFTSPNPPN
jgi:hypothetical protein